MNLAIIGSREFVDYQLLWNVFHKHFVYSDSEFGTIYSVKEIVSGGARGADILAKRLALELDIKYTEFLPDWNTGRGAGIIRNRKIVEASDMVLCFWDGISKGSKSSLVIAKELKKPTMIIYF